MWKRKCKRKLMGNKRPICLLLCAAVLLSLLPGAMAEGPTTPTDLEPPALRLRVGMDDAWQDEQLRWTILLPDAEPRVCFLWDVPGVEVACEVTVTDAQGALLLQRQYGEGYAALQQEQLPVEAWLTLCVELRDAAGTLLTSDSLVFRLMPASPTETPTAEPSPEPTATPSADPTEPTPEPPAEGPEGGPPEGEAPSGEGGHSGSGGSGGSGGRGGSSGAGGFGGMDAADSGSSYGGIDLTPGEALTSSHQNGSRDMTRYGTVALEVSGEPMRVLTLGGTELEITLDGGAGSFAARLEEDAVCLSADETGSVWFLAGQALSVLQRSGIAWVVVTVDGEEIPLSTGEFLSGREYAVLRAAGYVARDFDWLVSPEGITVRVDGVTYAVRDNQLVRKEE